MNADKRQHFLVQYRNEIYDITKFMHKHPGGVNTLKGLESTDMTERFLKAPPHSGAAIYLMKEYKRKAVDPTNGQQKQTKHLDEQFIDTFVKEPKPLEPKKSLEIDESMEHIVDWTKPMAAQIGNLKENYAEWVNKPVDRPLRLFGPSYLEMCTKTPWWVVPTFWIPVIFYFIFMENAPSIKKLAQPLIGIFIWTIIEYSLHRWVFHMNVNYNSRWLCTIHFLIHGLHHKVPFDPYRLVFPPLPAILIASLLYVPVYFFSSYPRLVLAGGLTGYVMYDMIHYYLHYGSPGLGHMYKMKRYHYQHHFVHHDLGYGISSPLWDFIFGTSIRLRKLNYVLKW